MRTGRPPKPTVLKKLHGTYRANRQRPNEPQPQGDLKEPPEWMDESQRAGWSYAITNSPPGLLKLLDRGILALWVEAEDRHRIAAFTQAILNRGSQTPYLVKSPDGLMISPYVEIMDRAAKIMFRAADMLGFSPVARPRIRIDKPKGDDAEATIKTDPWSMLRVIPGGKQAS